MGFTSWTCANTHLPILAGEVGEFRQDPELGKLCHVTVFDQKDRRGLAGLYDGYGRIYTDDGGIKDLVDDPSWPTVDEIDSGDARMAITAFLDPNVRFLSTNGIERGQGYFHDTDFLREAYRHGGFRSYSGYLLAFMHHLDVSTATQLEPDEADAVLELSQGTRRRIGDNRLQQFGTQAVFPGLDLNKTDALGKTFEIGRGEYRTAFDVTADGRIRLDAHEDPMSPDWAAIHLGDRLAAETAEFDVVARRRFVGDGDDQVLGTIEVTKTPFDETFFRAVYPDGGHSSISDSPKEPLEAIGVAYDRHLAMAIRGASIDMDLIRVGDDWRNDVHTDPVLESGGPGVL